MDCTGEVLTMWFEMRVWSTEKGRDENRDFRVIKSLINREYVCPGHCKARRAKNQKDMITGILKGCRGREVLIS